MSRVSNMMAPEPFATALFKDEDLRLLPDLTSIAVTRLSIMVTKSISMFSERFP